TPRAPSQEPGTVSSVTSTVASTTPTPKTVAAAVNCRTDAGRSMPTRASSSRSPRMVSTRNPVNHGTIRGTGHPAIHSTAPTYQHTAPAAMTRRWIAGWIRCTTTYTTTRTIDPTHISSRPGPLRPASTATPPTLVAAGAAN